MQFEVGPAGELGMRIAFQSPPEPSLTRLLLSIQERAKSCFGNGLIDSVVGYTTLTLFFAGQRFERDRTLDWLKREGNKATPAAEPSDALPTVTLPTFYHPSVAPDLEWIADSKSLSIDAVIDLHSAPLYFAYATGFAPGFCYLGTLPAQLATPRLATPRKTVTAGTVAIADQQTAVYPCDSPGGWHLIGACPTVLFDIQRATPALLYVGARVKFEPVSESVYRALRSRG